MFSKSFLLANLLSLNLITSITGVDINVERGKVESRAVDSADRWDEHACLAAVTWGLAPKGDRGRRIQVSIPPTWGWVSICVLAQTTGFCFSQPDMQNLHCRCCSETSLGQFISVSIEIPLSPLTDIILLTDNLPLVIQNENKLNFNNLNYEIEATFKPKLSKGFGVHIERIPPLSTRQGC